MYCPTCRTNKRLEIPNNVVLENDNITTVSIPADLVCEHSFQAFIDKDFHVRGYQTVDFEIPKMEIYGQTQGLGEEQGDIILNYGLSLLMRKLISTLRQAISNNNILGSAIITDKGRVLYSTLTEDLFLKTISEFEKRRKYSDEIFSVKKMFYLLESGEILFADNVKVKDIPLIIINLFPSIQNFKDGFKIQQEIKNSIVNKNFMMDKSVNEIGNYWIYTTIQSENIEKDILRINIDAIELELSKSVILNIDQIENIVKHHSYEGKIYVTDRYVDLMRGLSYTIKNASIFMQRLNKIPDII
ncbi:MAG: hypothetical protein GF317_06430 [Candidatus Lokiarchaeota archaeon]|nr:hypothetical protein [Candidatus Lokiarchaeota archaeon]MBD3199358.1 hypothetical protein [Candidatus Lokiarchaeota archaeon]